MKTRTQAIKHLARGFKLARVFQGVESSFNLTLVPCGKYTDNGWVYLGTDAYFSGHYKVRLTTRQVLSYIKRHFPKYPLCSLCGTRMSPRVGEAGVLECRSEKCAEWLNGSANMGVCPSPTLED